MFGRRVKRNEDPRLLKGEGTFVDDIPLEGCLHVAFTRSQFARAKIESLDTRLAEDMPGVIKVYTCENIGECNVNMPMLIPHPCITHGRTQYPLARDEVYYVGQTIAMVVATNRYIAEDAARLIDVEYEPLDVEMNLEKAIEDNAPRVHADVPNNVAAHLVQKCGDAASAFECADHITKLKVQVDRSTASPMECRAVAARWDQVSQELVVWDSTQGPIPVRGAIAAVFDLDEHKVRVVALMLVVGSVRKS